MPYQSTSLEASQILPMHWCIDMPSNLIFKDWLQNLHCWGSLRVSWASSKTETTPKLLELLKPRFCHPQNGKFQAFRKQLPFPVAWHMHNQGFQWRTPTMSMRQHDAICQGASMCAWYQKSNYSKPNSEIRQGSESFRSKPLPLSKNQNGLAVCRVGPIHRPHEDDVLLWETRRLAGQTKLTKWIMKIEIMTWNAMNPERHRKTTFFKLFQWLVANALAYHGLTEVDSLVEPPQLYACQITRAHTFGKYTKIMWNIWLQHYLKWYGMEGMEWSVGPLLLGGWGDLAWHPWVIAFVGRFLGVWQLHSPVHTSTRANLRKRDSWTIEHPERERSSSVREELQEHGDQQNASLADQEGVGWSKDLCDLANLSCETTTVEAAEVHEVPSNAGTGNPSNPPKLIQW